MGLLCFEMYAQPHPIVAKTLDTSLILYAEHDFNGEGPRSLPSQMGQAAAHCSMHQNGRRQSFAPAQLS